MSDLHTLLAGEAERLQPHLRPPFEGVRRRARRRARKHAVVGATTGMLTLATATVAVVATVSEPGPTTAAAPGGTTSFQNSDLTFRHPQEWRVDPAAVANVGEGRVVTLATEPIADPCRPIPDAQGEATACASLHVDLGNAGVLVSWLSPSAVSPGAPGSGIAPIEWSVDGRAGTLWRGPAGSHCRSNGGGREIMATIPPPEGPGTPGQRPPGFTMQACLAAPYDQSEQQVLDMLDSVQFSD